MVFYATLTEIGYNLILKLWLQPKSVTDNLFLPFEKKITFWLSSKQSVFGEKSFALELFSEV